MMRLPRIAPPAALMLALTGPLAHAQTPAPAPRRAPQTTTGGMTAASVRATLRRNSDRAAASLRASFGADNLKAGLKPRIDDNPDGLTIAWIIDLSGATLRETPRVVSDDGTYSFLLQPVGDSGLWAGVDYRPQGIAARWSYLVNGTRIGSGQIETYPTAPELKAQAGVPKGVLTKMPPWTSQIFAGTVRDWWVYVPAQYDPNNPPAVCVFQDGGGSTGFATTVFDNMIAKGDIPPTVGIFINPGTFIDGNRSDRSIEYDTLSDKYARFLLEEILPEVEKTTKLTHDPNRRIIEGVSSGGICAWTVAWERPDEFRNVITGVGSFVNLQGGPTGIGGGHNYPTLIRKSVGYDQKTPPKPIRIYMTDGANDLDNPFGNWPNANQGMDKALSWAGYDHRFVFGNGFHGGSYIRALFPDALRWVWRTGAYAPQKAGE